MIDRYKKSGGFVQLLQVIETCGPKKQEQFMNIINEETPRWGEAINSKKLSFERIISWKPEAVMEIAAQINSLAFGTALKSLPEAEFKVFCEKLSPSDRKKFETIYKEGSSTTNEISACIVKVLSETRGLFNQGILKFDKVDPALVIPDEFESKIEKQSLTVSSLASSAHEGTAEANSAGLTNVSNLSLVPSISSQQLGNPNDIDSLRRKIVELNQIILQLKKENQIMKDKLDKIKKIA